MVYGDYLFLKKNSFMVLGRIGQACHGRLSRPTKSRAIKTIVHNHWRGKNDIVKWKGPSWHIIMFALSKVFPVIFPCCAVKNLMVNYLFSIWKHNFLVKQLFQGDCAMRLDGGGGVAKSQHVSEWRGQLVLHKKYPKTLMKCSFFLTAGMRIKRKSQVRLP